MDFVHAQTLQRSLTWMRCWLAMPGYLSVSILTTCTVQCNASRVHEHHLIGQRNPVSFVTPPTCNSSYILMHPHTCNLPFILVCTAVRMGDIIWQGPHLVESNAVGTAIIVSACTCATHAGTKPTAAPGKASVLSRHDHPTALPGCVEVHQQWELRARQHIIKRLLRGTGTGQSVNARSIQENSWARGRGHGKVS